MWFTYKHDIVGSLVRRNDNISIMKRGNSLNSFLVFKYQSYNHIDNGYKNVSITITQMLDIDNDYTAVLITIIHAFW